MSMPEQDEKGLRVANPNSDKGYVFRLGTALGRQSCVLQSARGATIAVCNTSVAGLDPIRKATR